MSHPASKFRPYLPSAAVALAVLVTAIVVTMLTTASLRAGWQAGGAHQLPAASLDTFTMILLRNGSTCLALFTGVITFGIGSLIGLLGVGAVLGLSMGVAVDALGLWATVGRSWLYTPFEVLGFAAAGAGGLLPILTRLFGREGEARTTRLLPRALHLLVLALIFIVVGAGLETLALSLNN